LHLTNIKGKGVRIFEITSLIVFSSLYEGITTEQRFSINLSPIIPILAKPVENKNVVFGVFCL